MSNKQAFTLINVYAVLLGGLVLVLFPYLKLYVMYSTAGTATMCLIGVLYVLATYKIIVTARKGLSIEELVLPHFTLLALTGCLVIVMFPHARDIDSFLMQNGVSYPTSAQIDTSYFIVNKLYERKDVGELLTDSFSVDVKTALSIYNVKEPFIVSEYAKETSVDPVKLLTECMKDDTGNYTKSVLKKYEELVSSKFNANLAIVAEQLGVTSEELVSIGNSTQLSATYQKLRITHSTSALDQEYAVTVNDYTEIVNVTPWEVFVNESIKNQLSEDIQNIVKNK